MSDAPFLSVSGLRRIFGGEKRLFGGPAPSVHALQDVSFEIAKGQTLGVVGESGCGKSTLARLVAGLDHPTDGSMLLQGEDLAAMAKRDGRALARRVQYVFQDPVASLNPRKTIRAALEAPLIHLLGLPSEARSARLTELMEAVNLAPEFLERYPHEFSGGQAQRIAIARALAAEPELIVLDEPVSALDVSVQAQVLNLLDALKARFDLTYMFISHDLSVVESVADEIAVMYFGQVAEIGPAREVFARARHPYTRLLLNSAPTPGRQVLAAAEDDGELPDPYDPPAGCAFSARCPRASETCLSTRPRLTPSQAGSGHRAACHHPHE